MCIAGQSVGTTAPDRGTVVDHHNTVTIPGQDMRNLGHVNTTMHQERFHQEDTGKLLAHSNPLQGKIHNSSPMRTT